MLGPCDWAKGPRMACGPLPEKGADRWARSALPMWQQPPLMGVTSSNTFTSYTHTQMLTHPDRLSDGWVGVGGGGRWLCCRGSRGVAKFTSSSKQDYTRQKQRRFLPSNMTLLIPVKAQVVKLLNWFSFVKGNLSSSWFPWNLCF